MLQLSCCYFFNSHTPYYVSRAPLACSSTSSSHLLWASFILSPPTIPLFQIHILITLRTAGSFSSLHCDPLNPNYSGRLLLQRKAWTLSCPKVQRLHPIVNSQIFAEGSHGNSVPQSHTSLAFTSIAATLGITICLPVCKAQPGSRQLCGMFG